MTWLFLSLSAAFTWAIGNVFAKKGLSNIPPLWTNICSNIVGLILWVPLGLYFTDFNIRPLSLSVFLSILIAYSCYYMYYYTLSRGELSLTGTILATYPIATVLLSVIFLGERLNILQVVGIIVIILGGILIALPKKSLEGEIKDYGWLKWGIITSLLIGSSDFLLKYSVNSIGAHSQIFYIPFVMILVSAATFYIDKENRKLPKLSKKLILPSLLGVLLFSIGNVLFFLAYEVGNASLVAPVSSIYPALMVILAVFFLKEKVSFRQFLGIGGTTLGIILLGLNL